MNDDTITTERACCPACHRRGRSVTVGFAVQGHGLFGLTRRARGEDDEDDVVARYWDMVPSDARVSGVTFHRPKESSRVSAVIVGPTEERTIRCRYGHELRVPSTAAIDRMLEAAAGPIFLRSVNRR